ncbi:hypothetical protein [Asticcacaulis excentricus]|uniref:DNA primase bacterial type n=1 Tax=Asticcacaulis excentricus TaxID=78587 RepID=A0A3G9G6M8_9CAUL|nr:hypothetical protein [Asticcacaulis excentricus]BBF79908.1 DNA primase bacterial type [Asticcacaulis excentricus]
MTDTPTPETPPKKRGRPSNAEKMRAALILDDEDDIAFETVKQAARNDPVMGAPMRFVNANGDEEFVPPGEWMRDEWAHLDIVDPETNLPRNMPVEILGMDAKGLTTYVINTKGMVVTLPPNAGKGHFDLVFAGRSNYLTWLFPRYNKKGTKVVGWEADEFKRAVADVAGWSDVYDPDDSLRGRGMWRDKFGNPVYHAGDAILHGGRWKKPGRHDKHIYSARTRTGRPRLYEDLNPAGQRCYDILRTWNWERPDLDPVLQLGWVMTAKMGAFLFRRPAVWLTGPRGSGKSYLQGFLRSLMHEALLASSNASQAYIYRKLGQDCVPVLVDEQESKADTALTDRLLDLVRASYSGDDLGRADKDGGTVTFTLRSSFLASSIAKPSTEASDDSRMALLSLRATDKKGGAYTHDEAYRLGQVLTYRAIRWAPRWDALLETIEKALALKKGHTPRSLDTFAPFMAGFHIALYDQMPTEEQCRHYAALVDPSQLIELNTQMDDWEKCMRFLLGAVPDLFKNRTKEKTIGQIVRYYQACGDKDETDALFRGLRVSLNFKKNTPMDWDHARLFVPNSDPALIDLFNGTNWGSRKGNAGTWNGVLKQAPRDLYEDATSTKGGIDPVRGLAFSLPKLIDYLNGGHDEVEPTDPGMFSAPDPEPPVFDRLQGFEDEDAFGGGR